jgi:pyrroloquinoline-quinone synthase
MSYLGELNKELDKKHLLQHPFYKHYWNEGKLTKEYLGYYATQYFQHVDAFPRYLSATHANCTHLPSRQILLDNLIDEEKGDENHPELWLRFAEAVGETRDSVTNARILPETKALVDTFMSLARSSYAEGLGALYTYERQVPDVAKSKIKGLKEFYGIDDEESIKFFEVHIHADEWHSQETATLMEALSPEDQAKAIAAAQKAADALWNFLTGVQRETLGMVVCEASESVH